MLHLPPAYLYDRRSRLRSTSSRASELFLDLGLPLPRPEAVFFGRPSVRRQSVRPLPALHPAASSS